MISPEHSASAKREVFQNRKPKETPPAELPCSSTDESQKEPQSKDITPKEAEKKAIEFTESDAEAGVHKTDSTY